MKKSSKKNKIKSLKNHQIKNNQKNKCAVWQYDFKNNGYLFLI